MNEKLKDLGYGIGVTGGIIGIMFVLISGMELIGLANDTIRLAIAVPFFVYFMYLFGGLTRSILKRD
jgi:CDP-diglyceride synthetase